MAKPPWQQRLRHMLEAISAIEQYTAGLDASGYAENRLIADAVERNLERLSEASRHIPADVKARFPGIPWRQVADAGNVLRHAYDGVSDARVFQTVRADLPALKGVVQQLLREDQDETNDDVR